MSRGFSRRGGRGSRSPAQPLSCSPALLRSRSPALLLSCAAALLLSCSPLAQRGCWTNARESLAAGCLACAALRLRAKRSG
jgi:hypothetical protein